MKTYYLLILTIVLFILFNFSCTQEIAITPGKYVLEDDSYVFLILQPDMSFQLQANFCEGLGSYFGSYRQEKGILVCTVEKVDFQFSGWEEIKEFKFKITSTTNLQYMGEQVACGPYEEVTLKKTDKAEDDTDEDVIDDSYNDIFTAAEEGNLEAVKRFIESGEEVDAKNYAEWTPLGLAVEAGQEEVVEYLVEMGADVNEYQCTGPMSEISIFELAMNTGNQKIIDLILNAGVDEQIVKNCYDEKFYEYLEMDEIDKAEALINEGKVNISSDPSLILLVHYTEGSGGARELIRKYGPPEIADGSINLLDQVIPGSISFEAESDDYLSFPLSTTFKYDKSDPFRFSPEKAFDNDENTLWQEGVEGSGIGEKIAFYAEGGVNLLSIIPGIDDTDNFKKYNRIKKAHLRFYIEKVDPGQIESDVTYKSVGDEYDLDFMDIMGIQEFPIELPEVSSDEYWEAMVCVLEIADVYPGTDYDDTCITEIRLDLDTRYGN